MAIQTALRVRVPHVHGTLLKVIEDLAHANIYVKVLAALAADDTTIIELLPMEPSGAQVALEQAALQVEVVQVALAWLPNQPNSLLRAVQAVVGAGLTVDGLFVVTTDPVQGQQVAIECADVKRADQLLWALAY